MSPSLPKPKRRASGQRAAASDPHESTAQSTTRDLPAQGCRWAELLAGDRLALSILKHIARNRKKIARQMRHRLTADIPSFHQSFDPGEAAESLRHAESHCRMLSDFATGRVKSADPFAYVRAHAVMRARQRFPLDAVLHAYRIGHSGCWAVLRDLAAAHAGSPSEALATVLRVSAFFLEYTDRISSVLTEAYTAEERLLLEQSTRSRWELMRDLLAGMPPRDPDARCVAKQLQLEDDEPLRVISARPLDPRDGHDTADLLELRAMLQQALAPQGPPPLLASQDGKVVGIVSDPNGSKPTVLARLERLVHPGGAARFAIGVSAPVNGLGLVPLAHAEANSALKLTSAKTPLVALDRSSVVEYLNTFINQSAIRILPSWAGKLDRENRTAKGETGRTLAVFAQASLHVKEAARILGVHPNTIYFRLNRVHRLTGVNPRSFSGLSEVLLVLRVCEARHNNASRLPIEGSV